MFGIGNRNNRSQDQIPYEVYETVQEPNYRLRRWIIRLVVVLLFVTLLIFAGVAIKNLFDKDDTTGKPATQSQSDSGQESPGFGNGSGSNNDVLPKDTVNQQPQQNTAAPDAGTPATTPQSGTTNNSTVRKPQ
jgi:cytoskeletal protein RodZ